MREEELVFDDDEEEIEIEISQWDYIEEHLRIFKIEEKEIIELFGITQTELRNWKKGKREIPIDKIAVLCELFGITIDEFYNKDFSEIFYYGRISLFKNPDCKKLNYSDLKSLFWAIDNLIYDIYLTVEAYCSEEIEIEECPKDLIFTCENFDIDVQYDLKDEKKVILETISAENLWEIIKQLKSVWGEKGHDHLRVSENKKYDRFLMLSENDKFLNHYVNGHYYAEKMLSLWVELRNEDQTYDEKYKMARILLGKGATFMKEGKVDSEKTLQLCQKIFEIDLPKEEA